MRHAQRWRGLFLLASFLFAVPVLSGCDDGSKTSGTQRQVNEASQAHLKSKIESYKGGSPKAKGKAPEGPAEKK